MASASDVAADAGARDIGAWLVSEARCRRVDVAADLRLAEALDRDLEIVSAGMRDGVVTLDQAHAIARSISELSERVADETVMRAEECLVGQAANFEPVALRRLGRRILEVVAPEIAEAAEAHQLADLEAAAARRCRLTMRALGDGTTRLSAVLPDASAARLATYLHAHANPRRDVMGADGQDATVARLPFPRRAAEAFCALLEGLDPERLPVHGGDATTVVVTVGLDSLRAEFGVGLIDNGIPGDGRDQLSAQEVRRLACNAKVIPAVLGGRSEVLDLGRARRLFSRAQRKALLLRDRRCRAEGCDIPGTWSEAHHWAPWHSGGDTDLSNGVLLCSHHHHRAHDPAYVHERLPDGDVRFRCRRQTGWREGGAMIQEEGRHGDAGRERRTRRDC
jgi:hypothetical protein